LTDYLLVCIRQPLVSGLEKGSGHHVVGRKRKGGRLISFQWSHVAHFCLHGTHLHSKNEDGTWVHYPEIDDRRGLDLSHKCHVPDCVNKHHISFEPWWLNLARNCCRFAGRCLGEDVHPGADRCIFTVEAKRVVSSEVYPEVPIPPGDYRRKPGPKRGSNKTTRQLAYDGRRSEVQRQISARKSPRTRRMEAMKRAASRRDNRRRKERQAPAPLAMRIFVQKHHTVTMVAKCNDEENNTNVRENMRRRVRENVTYGRYLSEEEEDDLDEEYEDDENNQSL
jgi:hypothetical protein